MIDWTFVDFGSGDFRLTRVEGSDGNDRVLMDLVAEQPWGSLAEALRPWGLPPDDVAYEMALARQRREQDVR